MHDLQRTQLHHATVNDLQFLDQYLGRQVMNKLKRSSLALDQWNADSVALFRQLCEAMAERMPSADHVIRADTGEPHRAPEAFGPLLMYFGVQLPSQGTRSQFVGVGARQYQGRVSFTLFVAGASNDHQRAQRAAETDPEGLLDGFVINIPADLKQLLNQAGPLLQKLQSQMEKLRVPQEGGFMPVLCQNAWEQNVRNREAGAHLWAHWQQLKATLPAAQIAAIQTRLQENNGFRKQKVVSLIEQHVPAQQAFEMGLSEAA